MVKKNKSTPQSTVSVLRFYMKRRHKKESSPHQLLKLGKYNLRQTNTHDKLQQVVIYLTKKQQNVEAVSEKLGKR